MNVNLPRRELFHGSFARFSEFRPWSHFGTCEQALHRIEACSCLDNEEGNAVLYRVRLELENPFRVADAGEFDSSGELASALECASGIFAGLNTEVCAAVDTAPAKLSCVEAESIGFGIIEDALTEAGFDSLVYANDWEGRGDSYVILAPWQVEICEVTEVEREALAV